MKNIIEWIRAWAIVLSPFLFLVLLALSYGYTQRFIKHDNIAIRGVFFTDEILLEKHRFIGRGNGLFGAYESYSRSDRQEFIKVYFK